MVEESHSTPTQQKRANVALLHDHLNLCKTFKFKYASKSKAAVQEKYDLLMANDMWELIKNAYSNKEWPRIRRSIK